MTQRTTAINLFLAATLMATAACGGEPTTDAETPDTPTIEEAAEGSEGGEGGEGGEYSEGEKANAEFQDKLSGAALLSELQNGGHIIYFRHAQTERDYADQADPNLDLNDCETQRKLSDVGIEQAEEIGSAFEAQNIPVGDVIASDYCRAWQTAELAFGRYEKNAALNFLPFEDYTDAQVEEMKSNVMPLLTEAPEAGQNTVIVGH
ncbi:MAG: histidine phosphatase family protein, partial [Leptolyngbya sp. SIO4C1]|nr:histidine phosphatase family protein [Leptolyngbya sp. SIO4C1]